MKYIFKKVLQIIVIACCSLPVFSQVTTRFQGAFDYSGTVISFKLHAVGTGTANISVAEFFVRVPIAAPAFNWVTLASNSTNFPGIGTPATSNGFFLDPAPPPADLNYRYYHLIYTAPSPITTSASYTDNNSYEILRATIDINPGLLNMEMLHSPGDEDPFYLAVTDGLGRDLRPLTETTFFYPTTTTSGDPYTLALSGTVPTFLKDFNVIKQGTKGAFLSWTTTQEQDVSHFLIERSSSQIGGWTKIGEVKANGNSNNPSSYSFPDPNAYDGMAASKVVFYRIRAIDINASEKIFPIRSLRFSAIGKEISLYPNPANDGFVISIPIVNPGNNKIRLNMVNRLGQVVHAREISAANATNYFYDLKTPGIISGEYMLQIIYDGELLETKKVIVQH